MFCSKCGKEIKGGAFCQYCGAEQKEDRKEPAFEAQTENKTLHTAIKHKKTSNKVMFSMIGVVIVLCGALFLLMKPSKSDTFIDLLKSGNYTEAQYYYQKELAGNEKEVQKVYQRVTEEIAEIINSYYENAISYDDAVNGLRTYSAFYSTETNTALQDIEVLKHSKDIFMQANERYEAEDYREAHGIYAQVIETDSNYAEAQSKMEECYQLVAEQIFSICEMNAEENNYLLAIARLREELTFFNSEDSDKANEIIQNYLDAYVENSKMQIEQYLAENNYSACFNLLETAIDEIGGDDRLEQMLLDITETFEKYVSELVNQKINERDFMGAADILNVAKGELPDNEVFIQMTSELAEYTPVSIYSLEPYAIGYELSQRSGAKDTMGNVYDKSFRCGSSSGYYNVYDISKKYSVLTGIIAIPKESVGFERSGYVRIYGDNVLLLEENNITAETKPYEVKVNISGVTDLKIEMGGAGGYNGVHVLFANVSLQK